MKKHQFLKNTFKTFILFLLISFLSGKSLAQIPEQGLYERLGKANGIAAVVDDFVENLLKDEVVLKNEKVASVLGKISKPALKFHITNFVCEHTGGPERYTGRSMKESHENLGITDTEWNATVSEFTKSLSKLNVPKKEQDELTSIIGGTKQDIVKTPEVTPPPPSFKPGEIPGLPLPRPIIPEATPQAGELQVPAPPTQELPSPQDLPPPEISPDGEVLPPPSSDFIPPPEPPANSGIPLPPPGFLPTSLPEVNPEVLPPPSEFLPPPETNPENPLPSGELPPEPLPEETPNGPKAQAAPPHKSPPNKPAGNNIASSNELNLDIDFEDVLE